ncbi:MAG TPA: TIR domain-containing protein [Hyphomonadaceae bacterium]|nr:TIR domain-containing protein [Hyphomonadaceae bacterium]
MPKIFISYRREDADHQADRLHAALKRVVRNPEQDIFIDIDNIPVGVDFVDHLDKKVAQCDLLLALIGPNWLKAGEGFLQAKRLDDPKDFVRVEIAAALKRGIPVAPILLDGASMPKESDLPDDLKPLARRNAAEVRRKTFEIDTERMIRGLNLDKIGRKAGPKSEWASSSSNAGRAAFFVSLGVLAVGGAGAWVWLGHPFAPATGVVQPVQANGATVQQLPGPSPSIAAATTPQPEATPPEPVPPSLAATAWTKLDRASPVALRAFVSSFEGAPEAETAKLSLGKLDSTGWATALDTNTTAGFERYKSGFCGAVKPQGEHCADAASRIASLDRAALNKRDSDAWSAALGINSIASFQQYSSGFCSAPPQGAHCVDASSRIAALQRADQEREKQAAADRAKQAAAAQQAQELAGYNDAVKAKTRTSFNAFLSKYPASQYAPDIRKHLNTCSLRDVPVGARYDIDSYVFSPSSSGITQACRQNLSNKCGGFVVGDRSSTPHYSDGRYYVSCNASCQPSQKQEVCD